MKNFRPFFFWPAALAFAIAGCESMRNVHVPGISKEAPLRVGIMPTNPPLIFLKGGQPAGVEVDFANELGRLLDRQVEFVTVGGNNQYPSLVVNDVDILMSGVVVPTNNIPNIIFTSPYSTNGPLAWAVRPVDRWMIRDINNQLVAWYTNGTINRVLAKWGLPPSSPTAAPVLPKAGLTNALHSTPAALMQPASDAHGIVR